MSPMPTKKIASSPTHVMNSGNMVGEREVEVISSRAVDLRDAPVQVDQSQEALGGRATPREQADDDNE